MSKYNFELDFESKNSLSIICDWIKPETTILEFGPAHGRLTKHLKEKFNCVVDIIEIDENAGKECTKYARNTLVGKEDGDIENYLWAKKYKENLYDYIIFADVLEHLRLPIKVLEEAKKFLKPEGEILISIPNIAHNSILANLYNDKFNYTELGILDNTHIRFWGRENFEKTCDELGYSIKNVDATLLDLYATEQSAFFEDLDEELQGLLKVRTYGDVYQWVFKLSHKNDNICYDEIYADCITKYPMAVYVDVGNGYSEDNKMLDFVSFNKIQHKSFDLSKFSNIKNIRIDPIKGVMCKVKIISVKSKCDYEKIRPLNRLCEVVGEDWFETKDPNYELEVENHEIRNLEVSLLIEPLLYKEITKQREIFIELAIRRGQQAEGKLEELQVQLKETEVQLKETEVQLKEAEVQLKETEVQLKETEVQLEQSREQLVKIQSQFEETQGQLMQTQKNILKVQEAYDTINNSQIWKLTKPIRISLDMIKSTKIGFVIYKFCYKTKNEGIKVAIKRTKLYMQCKIKKILIKHEIQIISRNKVQSTNIFSELVDNCEELGRKVYLSDKIRELDKNSDKNVLLITHELSITGAPVALHDMARVLRELSYSPVVISPYDGKMAEEFAKDGIPVIVERDLKIGNWITKFEDYFEFAVANTAVTYYAIEEISSLSIETIWWIHEADISYTTGGLEPVLPKTLSKNIHIYCGGNYARSVLKKYRPQFNSEVLLYGVSDFCGIENNKSELLPRDKMDSKIVFAVIGTFEERKAQDKLAAAIDMLPNTVRERSLFLFIGRHHNANVNASVDYVLEKYPQNTCYIEEVSRNDLFEIYNSVDCVVCTSKDDPMPIFVTEAMITSKIIICSEFTGSADFLRLHKAGLVYSNNSVIELVNHLVCVVQNFDKLGNMKINARKVYESFFSQEVFKSELKSVIEKLAKNQTIYYDKKVSIIIPIYNPPKEFEHTLNLLRKQKNLKQIEIILINSGSKDLDAELILKVDKVILINQNEFSHSYARNLGSSEANGDIIVFMTQDAVPSNNEWLSRLIYPIWSEEKVAAASCLELCPEGTDMYYVLSSRIHSEFLGASSQDVYGEYKCSMDNMELRKNASLNDVACAVEKIAFDKFKYRFDYAEDLDLGLRLIKDGYRIKILGSIRVIHGHNRTPGYYLRRSSIEGITLKKILDFEKKNAVSTESVLNQITTAFKVVSKVFKRIHEHNYQTKNVMEFLNFIRICFNEEIMELSKADNEFGIDTSLLEEKVLIEFIDRIISWNKCFNYDEAVILHVSYFFQNSITPYVKSNYTQMDTNLVSEIKSSLLKQVCVLCGNLLSEVEDEEIAEYVQYLGQGV